MNTDKSTIIRTVTLIATLGFCLFSAFVAISELLFYDVPLQYEMLGSFYSDFLMKEVGEWIPHAAEFFEYFWIILAFVYVFGKIIFVAAAAFINYKKRMIGWMIPICIIFFFDIPEWLFTAFYRQDLLWWAIAGAVLRILLICGQVYTAYAGKTEE